MTDTIAATHTLVVERMMPHPPEKIWRAITATGIETIVTWTLTPASGGTHLTMEQSGFRPLDKGNYQGANYGRRKYFAGLERVAAGLS
jgi:uncharacterized protein YndB with AHSA1/START domain